MTELPAPYYQDSAVTLYHADCRDILPLLPKVDLVLTDPPYNVGLDYCDGDRRLDYKQWCQSWFKLLPRPIIFTPGMVNLAMWFSIERPEWVCAWVKPNQCSHSKIGGFNVWEPILIYGKGIRMGRDAWVDAISTHQVECGSHPCPKDFKAWSKLVDAIKADTILDPFAGSGTTGVAAKQLGRKAILIELDETYAEIAAKRLSQEELF